MRLTSKQHTAFLIVPTTLSVLSVLCLFVSTAPAQNRDESSNRSFSKDSVIEQNRKSGSSLKLANIRFVSDTFAWSVNAPESYTGGHAVALMFDSCPAGVFGSDRSLYVLISGGIGRPEIAAVTGGTCKGDQEPGTLVFTPQNDHSGKFTVGSASTGIYEALRDATATNPNNAKLVLSPTNPPTTAYYSIYAPIMIVGSFIDIDCSEATLNVETSRAAFVLTSSSGADRIHNCRIGTKNDMPSRSEVAAITQASCDSHNSTIFTTLNPPVNSFVDVQSTFNSHYWGLHKVATSGPQSWTYEDHGCGGAGQLPLQSTAGGNAYENALIEDDGAGNHFDHIVTNSPKGFQDNTLNNLFVLLNDQAAHISDVQIVSGLSGCTTTYCANAIYAPGPFSRNAAVIYADHLNFSIGCTGNGITDYSGNTLSVSDSVIQGFSEWGVATGVLKGGYGPSTFSNVYNEVGNCTNPQYPGSGEAQRAEVGLLAFGQSQTVRGGEGPVGAMPVFAATGNRRTQYNYYLIVHDSVLGVSAPLWCGLALVDSVKPAGNITVACPRVTGTNEIRYDLLRTSGEGGNRVYPSSTECGGGSLTACGAVLTEQPQCNVSICRFTDAANAKTSSYAVRTYPTYFPKLNFWPGSVVLDSTGDTTAAANAATQIYGDDTSIAGGDTMIALQSQMSSGMFKNCSTPTVGVQLTCLEGSSYGNNNPRVIGTLLQNGGVVGGGASGIKGRLNFFNPPGYAGNTGEVITLFDCHPEKTLAAPFYRPQADPCDSYIGLDRISSASSVGVAFGASESQSWYVNRLPDDKNWSARLTASDFLFRVPIGTIPIRVEDLPKCTARTEGLHQSVTDSVTNEWGVIVAGSGRNHVEAFCDGSNWTVAAK